MPVTVGAIRKQRADKKRTKINLKWRLDYKKALHDMRKKPSAKLLGTLSSKLDKAAKKGVIAKNKASRLKARASKLIAKKKSN